jgi:hypothetical protein
MGLNTLGVIYQMANKLKIIQNKLKIEAEIYKTLQFSLKEKFT